MKIVDFEFDKEMDTLLRQTAQSETAFAAGNPKSKIQNPKSEHLDADEISAFAENALPAKMRVRATEHLADCARCRKIFSSLISFDAEAQSETIRAAAGVEKIVAAPAIPWYKRLFAFPQMSYAMGALALVFAAVIGFVVLQNRESAQNTSVAQIEETAERPLNGKGASSDGESVSTERFSSNASSINSAANSNTATAFNATTVNTASNTTTAAAPARAVGTNTRAATPEKKAESDRAADGAPEPASPVAAPAPQTSGEVAVAPPIRNDAVQNDESASREAERTRNETQNNSASDQQNIAPDSRNVQRRSTQNLPLAGRSQRDLQMQEAPKSKAAPRRSDAAETRSAGGRNFRRADGVWYDANYRNQKTVNVRRGTDEYKKLDSGLRSIAENLGGVVVVIWNGKAYRIQ